MDSREVQYSFAVQPQANRTDVAELTVEDRENYLKVADRSRVKALDEHALFAVALQIFDRAVQLGKSILESQEEKTR